MNTELFLYTLPYIFYGMAGIFIVTLVIILSIVLLNKISGGLSAAQAKKNADK